MALKSMSKQMCIYIFIVNTYEVGHLYLTIRTEWLYIFLIQCRLLMSWLLAGHLCFAVVSPLIWLVICWCLLVDSLKHFKGSSCFRQQETLLWLNACTCWSKEQIECSANLVRGFRGSLGRVLCWVQLITSFQHSH